MTTQCEFLNSEELNKFLYKNARRNIVNESSTASQMRTGSIEDIKPYNGILQKFVSPKGVQKSTLSIIWSRHTLFFERRSFNYDGEKYHTQILPVRGNLLPHRMKRIANIVYDKVGASRMVLHFRLDNKNRLWLLYCSSLRLPGEEETAIPTYISK